MVVLKLNNNGVWLLSLILTVIFQIIIFNINTSIALITTPLILAISLIISSNIKIITKKELVKPAKVQN